MKPIDMLYERNRRLMRKAKIFFTTDSILEIVLCMVVGFVIRFRNPELTETQLFVQFFWWWLVSFVVTIKAGFILWMVSK